MKSLPSRERGLKLKCIGIWKKIVKSLPSRERGLKLDNLQQSLEHIYVAPLAGAWIETLKSLIIFCIFVVAPLAGAWIETVE